MHGEQEAAAAFKAATLAEAAIFERERQSYLILAVRLKPSNQIALRSLSWRRKSQSCMMKRVASGLRSKSWRVRMQVSSSSSSSTTTTRWASSRRAGQPRRHSQCRPHRDPTHPESTSSTSAYGVWFCRSQSDRAYRRWHRRRIRRPRRWRPCAPGLRLWSDESDRPRRQ